MPLTPTVVTGAAADAAAEEDADVAVVAVAVLPTALVLWPVAVALVLLTNRGRGHGACRLVLFAVALMPAPVAVVPPAILSPPPVAIVAVLRFGTLCYFQSRLLTDDEVKDIAETLKRV